MHVFNNYYSNVDDYGIASTMNAGVRVEGNDFDDPADTPLDLAGAGTLQVILLGMQLPTTTGVPEWAGPNPVLTPQYPVLREVNVRGQFEGQELRVPRPLRPTTRSGCSRSRTRPVMVVDVRHDG